MSKSSAVGFLMSKKKQELEIMSSACCIEVPVLRKPAHFSPCGTWPLTHFATAISSKGCAAHFVLYK